MEFLIKAISVGVMPFMILSIIGYGLHKKVSVYDCFTEGAKSGIETIVKIMPPLVALLIAIGMFRESGAFNIILSFISPITNFLKIPSEVMPLALMRPISGSGSLAIVSDIIGKYGPDSIIGRIASVMMGSTETTFYTIAVYFGAVSIKNVRHSVKASLISDVAGLIASVWVCNMFF